MLKTKALKIAHYDFEDKKGRQINTSKLLVTLGQFGTKELCSALANDYELLQELTVVIDIKDNKFAVNSIEK